jgi:hypothetical protein
VVPVFSVRQVKRTVSALTARGVGTPLTRRPVGEEEERSEE